MQDIRSVRILIDKSDLIACAIKRRIPFSDAFLDAIGQAFQDLAPRGVEVRRNFEDRGDAFELVLTWRAWDVAMVQLTNAAEAIGTRLTAALAEAGKAFVGLGDAWSRVDEGEE